MKSSSFYIPIILCCLLVSPYAQSQLQKIYLHPKAAASGKQSNFLDSIRFIPLEVKDGIGLNAYNYVWVGKNYFLITDYMRKVILLYSKKGSFIKKISYKNLGETFYPVYDEYSNRIDFVGNNKNYSLTSRDRIKIMLAWNDPRNKKYFKKYTVDLNDTSLTIRKDVPQQSDILRAFRFHDNVYYQGQIMTSELFKDSFDYEFKIYKNNQLIKGFFPYNHINETKYLYTEEMVSVNNTDTPTINFITRPYCDTIYKMMGDSLYPAYQLVLPLENSLPPSFFTRSFKNKTERENFMRNNGWMLHQLHAFYESPRFIYCMVGYLSNFESYIYQKQTNTTYKIKNIKPDSSQYNLQILGDFDLTRKGDQFYKPLKAADLVAFFEKNKNVPVPKELESFLKSNPPAAAPVIIEFKLKN